MGHSDDSLHWKPASIAEIMHANDIQTRHQLADRLEPRGISRMTVYRQFTQDWNGTATDRVMKALAREFHVALSQLVLEPAEESA